MAGAPPPSSPHTRSPRSELVHAPHSEPAEREPSRTTSRPSSPAMQSTHALTAMQALLVFSSLAPTRPNTPASRHRIAHTAIPGPGSPRRRLLPSATPRRPPTPGQPVEYSAYSFHQRITSQLRTSPPRPQRPLTRPAPPRPHRKPWVPDHPAPSQPRFAPPPHAPRRRPPQPRPTPDPRQPG